MEKIQDPAVDVITSQPDNTTRQTALPIKVAQFTGKAELRLKIKQKTEMIGPKVETQLTCGPLHVFCTPEQLRIVVDVLTSLLPPAKGADEIFFIHPIYTCCTYYRKRRWI